jgi:hypothetical protein
VPTQNLGGQTHYRLRGIEGGVKARELDLLHPFEAIDPVLHELSPSLAAPLTNWFVYRQAFEPARAAPFPTAHCAPTAGTFNVRFGTADCPPRERRLRRLPSSSVQAQPPRFDMSIDGTLPRSSPFANHRVQVRLDVVELFLRGSFEAQIPVAA